MKRVKILLIILMIAFAGVNTMKVNAANCEYNEIHENIKSAAAIENNNVVIPDYVHINNINPGKSEVSVQTFIVVSIITGSGIVVGNISLNILLLIRCRKYKRLLKGIQVEVPLRNVLKSDNSAVSYMPLLNIPTLIRRNTGESIVIDKDNFVIGTAFDFVDYCVCNNDDIERRHACIIKMQDGFYIKDLYTANGTYINGMRIEKGRAIRIFSGNTISLAGEDFDFK
ncbi:MAG: FHA domain-containing protein [Coprococcus sp.]